MSHDVTWCPVVSGCLPYKLHIFYTIAQAAVGLVCILYSRAAKQQILMKSFTL